MATGGRLRSLAAKTVAVALLLVLPACSSSDGGGGGGEQAARTDQRPNIVFVVTDDLDTASPFWKAMPATRRLVRDRGTTFSNTFATNPLCCPARATLLTGKYPHNTEVFDSVTGLDAFAARGSKTTIGVRLQRAGYTTAFLGKYLNGYELDPSYVPPGWDEWFGLAGEGFIRGYRYDANHNGRMEHFGDRDQDYQTDVLERRALQFLDGVGAGRKSPFLLTLFPSAPHVPIEPARRHRHHPFVDAEPPRSPNFDEADISDKPRWLQLRPRLTPQQEEEVTAGYRKRLGSLLAVDEMVDAVAARLRRAGELDRTIFVFTSDNGYSFGSHRIRGKLVPYEESIRVPLAIAGPGVVHGTVDDLVIQPDLAATFYDLAGVDLPADVDGTTLVPQLAGRAKGKLREDFLVEYRGTYSPLVQYHTIADLEGAAKTGKVVEFVTDYRAVRSEDWLYVEWYAGDDHDYELYDMHADPYQLDNLLAGNGASTRRSTQEALQRRLEELSRCEGRGCRPT